MDCLNRSRGCTPRQGQSTATAILAQRFLSGTQYADDGIEDSLGKRSTLWYTAVQVSILCTPTASSTSLG